MGVSVIGGGALGTFVTARLVKAGVDARLVVRPGSMKDVGRALVRVNETTVEVEVTSAVQGSRFVVCTKAYDAIAAIPRFGSVTVLSNGLLAIREVVAVRAATTTHGCFETAPFEVAHAGAGTIWVEDPQLFEDFAKARLNPVLLDEAAMTDRLWKKLAANASLNPLTALLKCRNGEVLEKAEAEVRAVCDEIATIRGPGDDLFESVVECAKENARNYSSMYQDVKYGRRTEIDQLNGFVVRRAAALGLDAPVNARLVDAIKAHDRPDITRQHAPWSV